MDYLDETKIKINAQWNEIAKKLEGKLNRHGNADNLHLTLQQLIIKLTEIYNGILSEAEKFNEIKAAYNSADIPQILGQQQIKVNELMTKKIKLQTLVVELTQKFKEEAGFCKVSF